MGGWRYLRSIPRVLSASVRRRCRLILVVGANGMLGRDLLALLGERGRGVDFDEIDITSPDSVFKVIGGLKPEVVVNCAAYTDVDGCESNVETAMEIGR